MKLLLQVMPPVETIGNSTLQYGTLGAVAIILSYFAYNQYRRLIQKNDQLEIKVDKLQSEMMQLLVEERERMSELVKENTIALRDLQNTVMTFLLELKNNK